MKSLPTPLFLIVLMLSQVACTSISLNESHFIKPDKSIDVSKLKQIDSTARTEPVTITAADGTLLRGTLITVANAKATILYFGGNQFRLSTSAGEPAAILLPLQTNILLVDHRGYGQSGGTPTIANLKQDALAIFDFVKQQASISNMPVILHGHSLGSMMASYVASQRQVDALVLEGSVTNVQQMTATQIPWYAKPFVKVHYSDELTSIDNLQIVRQYTSPLLLITGEKDTQTPKSMAESLYQQAVSKHKQLYIAQGKHHGNALDGTELKQHYQVLLTQLRADKL